MEKKYDHKEIHIVIIFFSLKSGNNGKFHMKERGERYKGTKIKEKDNDL